MTIKKCFNDTESSNLGIKTELVTKEQQNWVTVFQIYLI
jgi:hypothetical protein